MLISRVERLVTAALSAIGVPIARENNVSPKFSWIGSPTASSAAFQSCVPRVWPARRSHAGRRLGLFEQVWRPALLVIQPDFVTIGRIMLFSSVNILNSKYLLAKFDKRAYFLRSSDKGRK